MNKRYFIKSFYYLLLLDFLLLDFLDLLVFLLPPFFYNQLYRELYFQLFHLNINLFPEHILYRNLYFYNNQPNLLLFFFPLLF